MNCLKCGKRMPYEGYCSPQCLIQSDKYQINKSIVDSFLSNLSTEQKLQFKYICDEIVKTEFDFLIDIKNDMKDLDPRISEFLNKNFWELI